jgi:hypothetical protein
MAKVSASITVAAGAEALQRPINIIEAAHDDGVLPPAQVVLQHGIIAGATYQTTPPTIFVASPCHQFEFSFLHEIGHFLDNYAWVPGTPFATTLSKTNDLAEWMNAVRKSPEIISLRIDYANHKAVAKTGYLLLPSEIWARSYAQWIVERSQDPALKSALDLLRRSQNQSDAKSQWSDPNFAPISAEINAVFKKRGWI